MNAQQVDLAQFEGSTPAPWQDNVIEDPDARLVVAAPLLLAEVKERRAQDALVRELMDACTEVKTRDRFDPKFRRIWDALAACYGAGVAQVKP